MKKLLLLSALILPVLLSAAPIKVMLLTGQSGRAHNWAVSSPILKKLLDASGRFTTTIVTSPASGADNSTFAPKFSDYQVIVVDYEGDEWPATTQAAFSRFVRRGGGFVSIHATDNAFPKWTDFLEMTGVGGWAGRNESSGPLVYWDDTCNCAKYDSETPGNATHPPKHDFQIVVRTPNHPITQGLPTKFMHAQDELYSRLRGPAKNLTVLATASAAVGSMNNATGRNEPMLMAITFGQGRVFHSTLGHVGKADNANVISLHSVAFIATFLRGTEWAATGSVTQPVPPDFPTARKTSVRLP